MAEPGSVVLDQGHLFPNCRSVEVEGVLVQVEDAGEPAEEVVDLEEDGGDALEEVEREGGHGGQRQEVVDEAEVPEGEQADDEVGAEDRAEDDVALGEGLGDGLGDGVGYLQEVGFFFCEQGEGHPLAVDENLYGNYF